MESRKLFKKLFEKYFKGFDINNGLFGMSTSKTARLLFKDYYCGFKSGLNLCDKLASLKFVDLERDLLTLHNNYKKLA